MVELGAGVWLGICVWQVLQGQAAAVLPEPVQVPLLTSALRSCENKPCRKKPLGLKLELLWKLSARY